MRGWRVGALAPPSSLNAICSYLFASSPKKCQEEDAIPTQPCYNAPVHFHFLEAGRELESGRLVFHDCQEGALLCSLPVSNWRISRVIVKWRWIFGAALPPSAGPTGRGRPRLSKPLATRFLIIFHTIRTSLYAKA